MSAVEPENQTAAALVELPAEVLEALKASMREAADFREPAFSSVARWVERSNKETRRGLKIMATHGWYVDPNWIAGVETYIADLLETEPSEEMDAELCALIERNVDVSRDDLEQAYPHRATILRGAFEAHKRGEYAVSIPTMLAQADGICSELLRVQLHARDRKSGNPQLAKEVRQLVEIFASPLLEVHPISWNEKERAANGTPKFNRHAILHGESTDYATRETSCRAISYLRFVGWVLRKHDGKADVRASAPADPAS